MINNVECFERRESIRQYLVANMAISRWSRRELARRSGVSEEMLGRYFAGSSTPGERNWGRIREAFEAVGL